MRVRITIASLMVLLAVATAWAGQLGVRVLNTESLQFGDARGRVEAPMVITDPDSLAEAVGNRETADNVNSQVDFAKENVLYFKWFGSGEDRFQAYTTQTDQGIQVNFVMTPGMSLELRPHHHLFAVPKDTSWRIDVILTGADK